MNQLPNTSPDGGLRRPIQPVKLGGSGAETGMASLPDEGGSWLDDGGSTLEDGGGSNATHEGVTKTTPSTDMPSMVIEFTKPLLTSSSRNSAVPVAPATTVKLWSSATTSMGSSPLLVTVKV